MAKAKKLPSGNWRILASTTVNGVRIRKSFTAPEKKKAELAAAKWVAGVEKESVTENITLSEAYEKCIAAKSAVLSPSTLRAYESMQHNTFQDLMPVNINSLTSATIQRSVNILAADSSPKYVKNAYGLLSTVLSMFRPDFRPIITMPQKQKNEMYIPDDNDMRILLDSVKGHRIEIPVLLAAFGPMRRGEVCAVTSDDVHGNIITVNKAIVKGKDNKWHLKSPKTFSSYRNIEYPDFVIKRLEGISGNLTDMTPTAITDAFQKIIKKSGLPHFRFHDLRHYAVSTLHAINVPDKYIMARGGWSTNYTMNNVYNHALKSKKDIVEHQITEHFSRVFIERP